MKEMKGMGGKSVRVGCWTQNGSMVALVWYKTHLLSDARPLPFFMLLLPATAAHGHHLFSTGAVYTWRE